MTGQRKHRILDHPIIGFFLLMVFGIIMASLGGLLDGFIDGHVLGITVEGTARTTSGIGAAVGTLVGLGLFKLWFSPDFKGCLQGKGLLAGLLMLLPVLVIHYAGSVVSWVTLGTGSVFLALLGAFAPGFGEEIIFRGMGIANYMRTIRSEKQLKVIFLMSSIVFGLAHMSNILSGGDPLSCVTQSVYAVGIGMALGAVYLRTGNLLPCILGHMSLDFMEFIRADLSESGGIMKGMGAGDWITIAAALVGAGLGLYLMRPKYHPQIMKVWRGKWSLEDSEGQ